jgi:hypothetical protein
MARPGIVVVTLLKPTGLKPPPKPPEPSAMVEPANLVVPRPATVPAAFAVVPTLSPEAPPAELPTAVPRELLIKPELPPLLSKIPEPLAPATPFIFMIVARPVPPAVPPP